MTTRGIKDPYKGIRGIESFADMGDDAFKVFRCSGCGGEDVSMWDKDGVQHWHDNTTVCGTYAFIRPFKRDQR